MDLLFFGMGNSKLSEFIATFSLPAGYTCPAARLCLSRADTETGRIVDGPRTVFRCYAATMELRPAVRAARWRNLRLLRAARTRVAIRDLILASLSPLAGWVRVHESGDFYSATYMDAWMDVAETRPQTTFYAYTKRVDLWRDRLELVGTGYTTGRLRNVVLTASHGGKYDAMIPKLGLRSARVVHTPEEAAALGLECDHDDGHAMRHGGDFALLIHGTQMKGSAAGAAWQALKARGLGGYPRRGRIELPVTQQTEVSA